MPICRTGVPGAIAAAFGVRRSVAPAQPDSALEDDLHPVERGADLLVSGTDEAAGQRQQRPPARDGPHHLQRVEQRGRRDVRGLHRIDRGTQPRLDAAGMRRLR
jgi:hypothetical protein